MLQKLSYPSAPFLADRSQVAIVWDLEAEAFVRITMGPCGRILSRLDLEPPERRAAIRHLMATRTTTRQQRAFGDLLRKLGLFTASCDAMEPGDQTAMIEALSAKFLAGVRCAEASVFVEHMSIAIKDFLVLAWCVAMARARPSTPLPRLEDLDADYPYMPPYGPLAAKTGFNSGSVLEEIDADAPEREVAIRGSLAHSVR